jgi:uncharacterized protein (TIGR00255 family)
MNGMTGYSFKETQVDNVNIITEIKTVNSRFLDLNINLPYYLNFMEIGIRDLIKNRIIRGKVDILVNLKLNDEMYDVNVDLKLAEKYINSLNKIIKSFNLRDEIKLFHLTKFENIIQTEKKRDYNKYWKLVSKSLDENINEILLMRKSEGESIKKDIVSLIKRISKNVDSIAKKIPKMEKEIYATTKNKVKELLGTNKIDEVKLLNEVSFYVTKSCINEEIKRLQSHIEQFLIITEENNDIGKKLDFVCQELHREINTIGSKISLVELTSNVISVKNDIEKIREQIRNIE